MPIRTINVGCDNQAAIILATAEGTNKTKALANRVNYTREAVKLKLLVIFYVVTDEQKADVLTKFLVAVKMEAARRQLGLVRIGD